MEDGGQVRYGRVGEEGELVHFGNYDFQRSFRKDREDLECIRYAQLSVSFSN